MTLEHIICAIVKHKINDGWSIQKDFVESDGRSHGRAMNHRIIFIIPLRTT